MLCDYHELIDLGKSDTDELTRELRRDKRGRRRPPYTMPHSIEFARECVDKRCGQDC
jgi:hypothetical protein